MATKNTTITVSVAGSQNYLPASKTIDVNIITPDWLPKTWNNQPKYLRGSNIWTDGTNIYYSSDANNQYVLNKSTNTWETKTWNYSVPESDPIYPISNGYYIWTDGENIYYSAGGIGFNYILNKSTSTWITKNWNGYDEILGDYIWTDGTNIYYSHDSDQYILNKSTSTWSIKNWYGDLTEVYGNDIWTDGENIYCTKSLTYILNKSTSTWSRKEWPYSFNGGQPGNGSNIWTDGNNIYYSANNSAYDRAQYVLNKNENKWENKIWTGLTIFSGAYIWKDGDNIYYSNGSDQYVLQK